MNIYGHDLLLKLAEVIYPDARVMYRGTYIESRLSVPARLFLKPPLRCISFDNADAQRMRSDANKNAVMPRFIAIIDTDVLLSYNQVLGTDIDRFNHFAVRKFYLWIND